MRQMGPEVGVSFKWQHPTLGDSDSDSTPLVSSW